MDEAVKKTVQDTGKLAAGMAKGAAEMNDSRNYGPAAALAWLKVLAETERILGSDLPETPE